MKPLKAEAQIALSFLEYLKGRTQPVPGAKVAEDLAISPTFLDQIARRLRIAGLVRAVRGPGGGYYRPEGSVTVYAVLNAVTRGAVGKCEAQPEAALARRIRESLEAQLRQIEL